VEREEKRVRGENGHKAGPLSESKGHSSGSLFAAAQWCGTERESGKGEVVERRGVGRTSRNKTALIPNAGDCYCWGQGRTLKHLSNGQKDAGKGRVGDGNENNGRFLLEVKTSKKG